MTSEQLKKEAGVMLNHLTSHVLDPEKVRQISFEHIDWCIDQATLAEHDRMKDALPDKMGYHDPGGGGNWKDGWNSCLETISAALDKSKL